VDRHAGKQHTQRCAANAGFEREGGMNTKRERVRMRERAG